MLFFSMEKQKSLIQTTESKKKRVFILKLVIYLILFLGAKFIPEIQEYLIKYPSINSIHRAILFLLGGNILISLGRIITARIYLRKTVDEKVHGNFLIGITWISNILNSMVFVIALMLAFDIRPLEFLTSLTIVAAAIAILTKDYVNNIINGLIIMFTDQFSLGDTIKIGENTGVIEDITLLNVVIKKEDGYKTIIPNNLVLGVQVTNYSRLDHRKVDFQMDMPFPTKFKLTQIEGILVENFEKRIKKKEVANIKIVLVAIQKEVYSIKVSLESSLTDETKIKSELQQYLLDLLNEN
ncbi:mechanosensitive ion channel family protein [Aquiflexum sp. LQ15W]|uniref:mechanosensitive ion channel family protein n=1 Tax=Cognataquiflexum nitidum TaxID=2922272 RepID=UPI001F128DEF|nr:mechanosensitive ion channel domain-containing protein [Cognataquiflexum nitidum]MCH6198502.1 mechanosensitive ion channel family protein [Cognataquiflexum nitidum]